MRRQRQVDSVEYLALRRLIYKLKDSITEYGTQNKELLDFLGTFLLELKTPLPKYVRYRSTVDVVSLFPSRIMEFNSGVGSGLIIQDAAGVIALLEDKNANESLVEAVKKWYEDNMFLTLLMQIIDRNVHLSYTELVRDLPWIEKFMTYKKPLDRERARSVCLISKENSEKLKSILDYVCFIKSCTFTIDKDGTVIQKGI